ncbi:MAG: DUF1704 domain-containing protein, partial [Myxococcota bacterium]|nr:DUF1704 domain-containing protein [Myxococcota bacterium]
MIQAIPEPVIEADRVHHEVLRTVVFSRHLNPANASDAHRAFLTGSGQPPFRYEPLDKADDILRQFDRVEPPRDHPAGELVARRLDSTRLLIRALRDRTAQAFHALAEALDWYPDPGVSELNFPSFEGSRQALDVSASHLIQTLRDALAARDLHQWQVVEDRVMAARVLVDGAKKTLRVHPGARFRQRDLTRLVVHEIDVHATRTANGEGQPLCCFITGLPGSLATEEGLAMVSEEVAGVSTPGVLSRQVVVAEAILRARDVGFRDLYDELVPRVGLGLAWSICLRVKRGLADPGSPGVYAKDSVYLKGR